MQLLSVLGEALCTHIHVYEYLRVCDIYVYLCLCIYRLKVPCCERPVFCGFDGSEVACGLQSHLPAARVG